MIFKKRNGFTLIELLAVIVILAVIALIAVPQVIKILNKTRLSAAEDSTYGIVKSAESYVANFMLENTGTFPNSDVEFECSSDGCTLTTDLSDYETEKLTSLDFKGTKPSSGNITISNNGTNIITTDLVINGYVCGYINGKSECIEKSSDVKESGTVVYFNPETGMQCSESDYTEENSITENKQGCMKWYIFNDREDSMSYNLFLDHNTTAMITYNSQNNNKDSSEIDAKLKEDTKGWTSGLNPRLITADEIATIVGNTSWNSSEATISNGFYYLQTSNNDVSTGQGDKCTPNCKYAWLYDRTSNNCISYGCLNNGSGKDAMGYWTQTAIFESSTHVWGVGFFGTLGNRSSNALSYGIRPVIIVSKSKIL